MVYIQAILIFYFAINLLQLLGQGTKRLKKIKIRSLKSLKSVKFISEI